MTVPASHPFRLAADQLDSDEIEAAIECLRQGRYSMGATVHQFESALADWLGVRHAVMANSGSSANLLLIDSLLRRSDPNQVKLQPGDEVLVPALAWPTTVWPILQLGLVPVYVDIDPATLALDLAAAETALSPRTRGLFLIHVLGQACDMNRYVAFCAAHGLTLIEDCCESLGAFHAGRHVGTFGHGGSLSHYYSHHLSTIEGGTIITNDSALADDLRSLRAHGWVRDRSDRDQIIRDNPTIDPRFLFVMPGYNVRPIELEAAIGLVQLRKLDAALAAREELAQFANELIQRHTPWMRLLGSECLRSSPPADRTQRRHSWMMLPFMVAPDAPMSVEEIKQTLEANGVETRPIIAGNLSRHPAARFGTQRVGGPTPQADAVLHRGFMIGCHGKPSDARRQTLARAFAKLAR